MNEDSWFGPSTYRLSIKRIGQHAMAFFSTARHFGRDNLASSPLNPRKSPASAITAKRKPPPADPILNQDPCVSAARLRWIQGDRGWCRNGVRRRRLLERLAQPCNEPWRRRRRRLAPSPVDCVIQPMGGQPQAEVWRQRKNAVASWRGVGKSAVRLRLAREEAAVSIPLRRDDLRNPARGISVRPGLKAPGRTGEQKWPEPLRRVGVVRPMAFSIDRLSTSGPRGPVSGA